MRFLRKKPNILLFFNFVNIKIPQNLLKKYQGIKKR
ncbi:MAG: hypothetical protein K0Q53_2934 [Massilibacillus sp.]|nr:hypothetical protein [Massilibacillus sp.]